MGTRTAPAIDRTAATFVEVVIKCMDYTGDIRSDRYLVDADATDAELDALVDAHQALTNATVYRVDVCSVFNSVEDSSNAEEDVWEDVSTNLVVQLKTSDKRSFNWFVPAVVDDIFIEGTEEVDPTAADLAALLTALLAVKDGYEVTGARFSQRSVINAQTRF